MKRIVYLIIIVGVIVLGLAAGYFLRNQNAPVATTETPAVPATGSTGTLPPISGTSGSNTGPATKPSGTPAPLGNQNFGKISDNGVFAYFVDAGNTVTLMTPEGTVVRIASGSPTMLSNTTTSNLFAASFSFDGKFVLALSGNPASPSAGVFDTTQRTWRTLKIHPLSPAWSPVKNQFAYLEPQTNGTAVKTLDATNTKASPISLFGVGAVDLDLSWSNTSHMLLIGKPSAFVSASAWLYDVQKKTFATIADNLNGLMVNWNGTKNSGIYFASASNRGGVLNFVNGTAISPKIFSFLTLPSKCAFDNPVVVGTSTAASTLYCAIPRIADKDFYSAALPDDYLKYAIFSVDDISQINLVTGEIRPVWNDQNQAIDATSLQLKNGRVFFVNRYDGKLYAVTVGT